MKKVVRVLIAMAALAAMGFQPARPAPVPIFASPNIELIGTLPIDGGAISGQLRTIGGTPSFVVSTAQGMSVYDISNPAMPVPSGRAAIPVFENEAVDGAGNIVLLDQDPAFVTNTYGGLHVMDVSRLPLVDFAYQNATTGHRFKGQIGTRAYNGGHTIACIRADCSYAIDVGAGGGSNAIWVIELTNPSAPVLRARLSSPVGGTHHVWYESENRAWIMGSGGYAYLDTTNPVAPVVLARHAPSLDYIHNLKRVGNTMLITEEDWLQPACLSQGRFATADLTNLNAIRTLDVWQPPAELFPHNQTQAALCSAHWFTERNGIVAISWYQQGTYLLDVRNPSDIKPVGFFAPSNTVSWSAYWVTDDIIYVVDHGRGVDILKVTGTLSAATVEAQLTSIARSARPAAADLSTKFAAHPTWGFACAVKAG